MQCRRWRRLELAPLEEETEEAAAAEEEEALNAALMLLVSPARPPRLYPWRPLVAVPSASRSPQKEDYGGLSPRP